MSSACANWLPAAAWSRGIEDTSDLRNGPFGVTLRSGQNRYQKYDQGYAEQTQRQGKSGANEQGWP